MGARQVSQVLAMVQEMKRVNQLTEEGRNSTGAAMQAQDIWATSLEAKLQALTNSSQIFWQTFINTDGAKGFIDMMTSIVNGATKLTETFGSVGVAAGALSAIFITFTNNPIKVALQSLSAQLLAVAKSFISTGTAGAMGGKALEAFTLANVKAKLAVIGTTIATTAFQAVLTMGLSFAIMAVVGGISKLISAFSGANTGLKEFNEEATRSATGLTQNVENVSRLYETMQQLENEIANSDNSSVQAQKKKELLDVQAKIAEILPESVAGYDAEGRAISGNSDEVSRLLGLKKEQMVLDAMTFAAENKGIQSQLDSYKDRRAEYEKMMIAKSKNEKYSYEYESSSSLNNGNVTKKKIEFEVNDKKLKEANESLKETDLLAQQTKVQVEALRSAGMSDSFISEKLGVDIEALYSYGEGIQAVTGEIDELGESGNGASEGLGIVSVKIGDISVTSDNAIEKLKALSNAFSEFNGSINLSEKALDEFRKTGGLTIETKEKILSSGDVTMIAALRDMNTFEKELVQHVKDQKVQRDNAEQSAIATAYASKLASEAEEGKDSKIAEQNAKLDEQKGKIDEINQAKAEANTKEAEPVDYSADVTAKTTAEQNKTTVVNDESGKRVAKLEEEANTQFADVDNKTASEQLKTFSVIDQVNARIAENQRETTENQTSYTTDGTNFKTNEDKKVTDTSTTMSSIGSAVSLGMSGLATHYSTNASNFASSLTSMETSARTSVANINSILAGIKQPTIKAPAVSGGGNGGGADKQSVQGSIAPQMARMTADEMVGNLRVGMMDAIEPVSNVLKPITDKLPSTATLNPNLVDGMTEEERRRNADQIGSAVGNEISEVLPRVMASRAMANTPMAMASRAVITVNPNKIVQTVTPNKKPTKKPASTKKKTTQKKTTTKKSSSSSKSSSTKKAEKVDIKDIEDEIDRYKVLNDALNDVNHALAMNNKNREHAKGKDKYKYHYEEIKLLDKKKKAIEAVQKEEKKEMAELEKKLKANGFNPKDGNMSNHKSRLEQIKKQVNAMSNSNKAKEDAKKKYEDLKKAADRYFDVSNDLQKHKEDWKEVANDIKNAQIAMEEEAASEVEKIRDRLVDALKNKYEKMREVEISDLDKEVERLQKQLEDLDKQADNKLDRLAKLQTERAKWSKDDSAYGKAKVEELNQQIEELQKEIQKDEIQASIDNLEKEKDKVNEHYDNLLSDKNIYAEANNLLSTKSQKELLAMLTEFAPDYANIGELWGKSFADNFKKELEEAKNALDFLQGKLKPTTPPPSTSQPKPPTSGSGNSTSKPSTSTAVKKGDKVKITDKNATIFASSSTGKGSGNWGKTMQLVGRSDFKIVSLSGNRVSLSPNGKSPITGWIDKKYIAKFSKGGLTGLWNDMNGKKGKLAELHSGETILNKDQSELFYNNSTAKAFENLVNEWLPSLSNIFGNEPSLALEGIGGFGDVSITNNIVVNGDDSSQKLRNKATDFTKGMIEQMRKEGIIKKRR